MNIIERDDVTAQLGTPNYIISHDLFFNIFVSILSRLFWQFRMKLIDILERRV